MGSKICLLYNNEHRHSKIKYVTPMQRHTGEDKELLEKRKRTYEKARRKNPHRWTRGIRNWDHIDTVYLNPSNVQPAVQSMAA